MNVHKITYTVSWSEIIDANETEILPAQIIGESTAQMIDDFVVAPERCFPVVCFVEKEYENGVHEYSVGIYPKGEEK